MEPCHFRGHFIEPNRASWRPSSVTSRCCHSAGGVDEGSLTFEPCTLFVDEWVTVSEPEIARGMISVLEAEGERIEGALDVCSYCEHRATGGDRGLGSDRVLGS